MIAPTSNESTSPTTSQPTSPATGAPGSPPSSPPSSPPPAADRPQEPGPPPPPAASGGAGESRVTAATWLAALGAVLLLSAAGTFLAVTWDVMPLVARVAVVAAATGAAIFGGHRLRRVLPAVGSVVFHLGALLVPIDALGLALQLGVGVPGRWLAVGLTGVVVLPLLAVTGRSPVLAWAGIASVLVAATGFGLAGSIAAPVLAAGAGLVLTGLGGVVPGVPRDGGPALAATAVVTGLILAIVEALPGSGGLLVDLRSAGWLMTSLVPTVIVGALATAALVLATITTRSRTAAVGVVGVLGATLVQVLLITGSPQLALFVGVPGMVVLVELGVIAAERDPVLARLAARIAASAEALLSPGVLIAVFMLALADELAIDVASWDATEFGTGALLMGVAWALAALRRRSRPGAVVVLAAMAGVLHLAVGLVLVGAPATIAALVLLVAVAVGLVAASTPRRSWAVLSLTVVATWTCAHIGLAALAVIGVAPSDRVAVGAMALGLLTAQLALLTRTAPALLSADTALRWMTSLGGLALAIGITATAPMPAAGGFTLVTVLVVVLGVAALAALAEPDAVLADTAWVVAAGLGLLLVVPAWSVPVSGDLTVTTITLIGRLGLDPSALLPAGLVTTLLVAAAASRARVRPALFAAPVAVRTVTAAAFGLGATATQIGIALVIAAVVATACLVVVPSRWRGVPVVFAVTAGAVGWILAGDVAWLRATTLVGIGVALVVVGVVRRQVGWAHLGGVVATVGTWDAFVVLDVESLDLWVLPLAVHLFVAADAARRAGTATSSWFVDVPPILLVGGAAVVERLATGDSWHALLAGALAVAAVVHGAVGRHAGPLAVGTVLLLTVVGIEVFAAVVAVPTWAWLTFGGLTLFGAAALVERAEGTPMHAARRLIDVVGERFD
jgi:hypothetical protein